MKSTPPLFLSTRLSRRPKGGKRLLYRFDKSSSLIRNYHHRRQLFFPFPPPCPDELLLRPAVSTPCRSWNLSYSPCRDNHKFSSFHGKKVNLSISTADIAWFIAELPRRCETRSGVGGEAPVAFTFFQWWSSNRNSQLLIKLFQSVWALTFTCLGFNGFHYNTKRWIEFIQMLVQALWSWDKRFPSDFSFVKLLRRLTVDEIYEDFLTGRELGWASANELGFAFQFNFIFGAELPLRPCHDQILPRVSPLFAFLPNYEKIENRFGSEQKDKPKRERFKFIFFRLCLATKLSFTRKITQSPSLRIGFSGPIKNRFSHLQSALIKNPLTARVKEKLSAYWIHRKRERGAKMRLTLLLVIELAFSGSGLCGFMERLLCFDSLELLEKSKQNGNGKLWIFDSCWKCFGR
jgi:hypothetical protein